MFDGDEYRSDTAPGSSARRLRRRACRFRRGYDARGYCVTIDSRPNCRPIVGARLSQSAVEQGQY